MATISSSYLIAQQVQKQPFRVELVGCVGLNGSNVFEFFFADLPPGKRPGLKKTGDLLGFDGFLVGAFHENGNNSILELDQPATGRKVFLPMRRIVDLAK